MNPDKSTWNKERTYISSDKSELWVWIETEWKQFFAQEKVTQLTDAAVRAYELLLKEKNLLK